MPISGHSSPPSRDLLSTEELVAALEGLQLGPVHLVAHSIAAWQAMTLAAKRPELFRTLVLEEPAVDLRDAPSPRCALANPSQAELASCLFSSIVHGPGWFESVPAELRRYNAEFAVGTPQTDGSDETIDPAETVFPSICEEVATLPMPILFVRGEETPAYLQAKFDEHEACLPRHETVRIPGASHSVHIDRPNEYNRAVLEFIDRHERQSVRSDDGTSIGYVKIGSGPVPLVIVHGVLNTADSWVSVATALAARCTCYVIDRRGRGRSGDSESYSFDREIEDIGAVLSAVGPEAYLLGHSSGAIYALEAARRYPLEGLILYEPPLHYDGFENVVDRIKARVEMRVSESRADIQGFRMTPSAGFSVELADLEVE